MVGAKGRLKGGNGGEGVEVLKELLGDDSLKDFGEEVEVGNWTEVGQIVGGQGRFFEKGGYCGVLEGREK